MKCTLRTSCRSEALGLWILFAFIVSAAAQVNSGSNGSDGAFNPTQNVTIDMADHPTGIYQYTSVNIPSGVTVTFTPNANNTPVVWLVQGDCVIGGTVELSGKNPGSDNWVLWKTGAVGGPGGFRGGNGESGSTAPPTPGQGPGGGKVVAGFNAHGGSASFGTVGQQLTGSHKQFPAGDLCGNIFLMPLIGGSGGSGGCNNPDGGAYGGSGGGGGGGAIVIASSSLIEVNGTLRSIGGGSTNDFRGGGGGSGGGVRLIASLVNGGGTINCAGGSMFAFLYPSGIGSSAGQGRVRIDALQNNFSGSITGQYTQGFQPIIIPASGQDVQLGIQSIGGVSVAASPSGVLANPDVILPAQQTNPMNVVVNCSNLPMNTTITVTVRPANGADIVATGTNGSGTQTASTATIPVTMPRGGGIVYAKCVSGVAGTASTAGGDSVKNISETGWTAHGERFAQVEITAGIGSSQHVAYITESGKRYTLPVR